MISWAPETPQTSTQALNLAGVRSAKISACVTLASGIVAVLVLTLSLTDAYAPTWEIPYWRPAGLGLAFAAAIGLAMPVHWSAIAGLIRRRCTEHVAVSITLVLLAGWALAGFQGPGLGQRISAVALLAVLATATEYARIRADMPVRGVRWAPPALLLFALICAGGWTVAAGVGEGVRVSITVLTAASPVMLLLTAFATVAHGRRKAERLNLIVTENISVAASVDTIILDKHGTVTTGEMELVSSHAFDTDHERNLRWFAGALERACTNNIARALARNTGRSRVSQVEYLAGHGIRGSVDRHPVRVGRTEWIGIDALATDGTVLGVEVDGRALGYVVLYDEIRPQATDAVSKLSALGIEPILMSRRSDDQTARLAQECGIERWHAHADAATVLSLIDDAHSQSRIVAVATSDGEFSSALAAADMPVCPADGAGIDTSLAGLDVSRIADSLAWSRQLVARLRTAVRWSTGWTIIAAAVSATGMLAIGPAAGLATLGALLATLAIR